MSDVRCRYCGVKIGQFMIDNLGCYCNYWHMKARRKYDEDISRFLSKIDFVPDENGCFNWHGGMFTGGYGQIMMFGQTVQAHRFAYEYFISPIPNSLCVLHRCDNPLCCNSNHLWLGTHKDNQRDKKQKSRAPHGNDHYKSKLTEDQVLEIRRLYNGGTRTIELSKSYNIAYSTIHSVVTGRSWKWLESEVVK